MNKVADIDLEQLWDCASPDALRRTASLARRMFEASAATIHIFPADRELVRSVPDAGRSPKQPHFGAESEDRETVSIDVPIRLPCGRHIGALRVSAPSPRAWDDDDREILVDLAAQLASQIELQVEASRRLENEEAQDDMRHRLLAVADRIPGLIFERRKVDAGRSNYTFFGSGKTGLPAVRQMMEGGVAGLSFVHRDDREAVRAAILGSILEETDLDLTFRIKDFDRRVCWVRSQSIVRRDADGTVSWDGLCFDITDLVAARENAETAKAAKETLLLGIAAELQDALRAMIGMSQLMRTEERHDLFAAHARTIQVAAESMLDTLEQAGDTTRSTITPASAPSRSETAVATNAPGQAGARILLADDLDLNRKLIADMLTFDGHVVDCVADGAEAVRAVGRQAYDLILMDMIMPGMDGVAATKAIRALPKPACNVPIVALTANAGRDQLDGCLKAGMDAALTKPMSIEALTKAVAEWTRGRKAA